MPAAPPPPPPKRGGDHPDDPDWRKRLGLMKVSTDSFVKTKISDDPLNSVKLSIIKWFVHNAPTYTRIRVVAKTNRSNIFCVEAYDETNSPRRTFLNLSKSNDLNYAPDLYPKNLWKENNLND